MHKTNTPTIENKSTYVASPYKGIRIAIYLFAFLLLCFPYLKPFGVGTTSDVQPAPLAISLLIFITHTLQNKKINERVSEYLLFILTLMLLFLGIYGFDAYYFFRGLYGYISIIIITCATTVITKKVGIHLIETSLKFVFSVWTVIGIVQMFDPEIATFWRDKLIITAGRGSISLATEPAYFCLVILLISLSLIVISPKNKFYLFLSLLISAIVAKSSVGVIYSAIAIALFSSKRPLHLAIYAGIAIATIIFSLLIFQDSRIGSVLISFLSNPLKLAAVDQSFGLRLTNVLIPIKAFINDYSVPHGFYQWTYYQYEYLNKYFPEYLWINLVDRPQDLGSGRVLSIHGQLIFELGLIAPIFYILLWRLIRPHSEHLRIYAIFMIMFLNGLTLNNPFLSILISLCISTQKKLKQGNNL